MALKYKTIGNFVSFKCVLIDDNLSMIIMSYYRRSKVDLIIAQNLEQDNNNYILPVGTMCLYL